jgi:hypothetical protein
MNSVGEGIESDVGFLTVASIVMFDMVFIVRCC